MSMTEACGALAHHPYKPPQSTGTVLIGVEFDGGVVIGADSRTSAGNYVTSRVTNKLTPVTDSIFVCRSGSAADTQALADIVRYQLGAFEMIYGDKSTVEIAAQKFRSMGYDYRDDLSTSFLIGGWDEVKGGQIYAVPIGGLITRRAMAAGGSGSGLVNGYLDAQFREGMSQKDAENFVLSAVTLAIERDGSCGGICRLAVVTEKGTEHKTFLPHQLPSFYESVRVK